MSFSLVSRIAARPAIAAVSVRSFTSRSSCADFGWSKLVTPFTAPSFISRMKELDTKFASMKTEMYGVNPKVEPIDWATLEKGISNKAQFASIKKEYENLTFPPIAGEDLSKINADLDFAILKAGQCAAISGEELPRLRAELLKAKAEKIAIHNWTDEDYYAANPGLKEQYQEEFMNGDFILTDAEEKFAQMDIAEIKKLDSLPEGMGDRVGNYIFADEARKTDELLDRMFGGSKEYEKFKADEKAEKKKKQATEAASHAH